MIIKAVTSSEMREIDRISIEEIGIPASILMNNAGKSAAEFIEKNFKDKPVTIFCGTGNNGGDGFTAVYYLFNKGIISVIYLSGNKNKLSETSKIFMNLCEKMNIPIHEINNENISSIKIPEGSIIIDAVLGTGFEGVPKGIPSEFIRKINQSGNTVVSIDIPSGLSSDGDAPVGEFVHADYTITIGLPKISLVTYPCKAYCGEIIIEDIGFPVFLTSDKKLRTTLINDSLFRTFRISNPDLDIHKGDKGHTLIIGGFTGMEGAAILTASAIFRTGSGLVTIATIDSSREIIAGIIPEAMTLSLPEDPDSPELQTIINSKKITSIIIGPGLGRTSYSEKIFKNTINAVNDADIKRVLIDGDGLFHLSDFLKNEKLPKNTDFIITPHFMEASRILNKDINILKNNRLKGCIELALYTGCTAVLKGPASIISNGELSYINTSGNNGLATAGSGDVLSGIIGALMNRDISPIEAASAGVYIHGLCADIYINTAAASTMSASDIVNNIRSALKLKTVIN
jgi:NAD(P)H-hydrate epimerase